MTVAAAASPSRPGELRLVPIVTGYAEPVGLAVAPGEADTLYVVEQVGRVLVVQHGQPLSRPFLDIRGRVRRAPLLGLLGLAFDPRYESNHLFYVLYTGRRGREYVVSMRAVDGVGQPSTSRVLLRVAGSPDPYSHVGGQLAFGPDGKLYIGLGDGGDPESAQDLASPQGKILALDVRSPRSKPRVVAFGLRNPWRFSFDRKVGALFVGDVGGDLWEEIDRLRTATGPRCRPRLAGVRGPAEDTRRQPIERSADGPVAFYRHPGKGCRAVIGGYVYRGPVRAARGRYVFGDLCSGHILSFDAYSRAPATLRRERASLPGLTSFGEDAGGTLYAMSEAGGLYRLSWNGQ